LNTLFTFLYLAKHRSIVKRRVRGAMVTPLAEACDKLSAWGWHLLRGAPLRTKRYSERHSLPYIHMSSARTCPRCVPKVCWTLIMALDGSRPRSSG
jgi:hypothetical protein